MIRKKCAMLCLVEIKVLLWTLGNVNFKRPYNRYILHICSCVMCNVHVPSDWYSLVAGAWTEREKMFHGGSFLKFADYNMDIQNPEAQNRELSGF